jgi:hypothetical protein
MKNDNKRWPTACNQKIALKPCHKTTSGMIFSLLFTKTISANSYPIGKSAVLSGITLFLLPDWY